jgi:hypothetical protein
MQFVSFLTSRRLVFLLGHFYNDPGAKLRAPFLFHHETQEFDSNQLKNFQQIVLVVAEGLWIPKQKAK